MRNFFEFKVSDAKGDELALEKFRGQVILAVNVASRCGFTPQYEGLERLFKKYRDRGFNVIGFPCNQFGAQEPGTNDEIQSFCQLGFGVTFPVLGKVEVNGGAQSPVYGFLKKSAPGIFGSQLIKWNFTKFLISRQGQVLERFAPATKPEKLEADIEKALGPATDST